MKLKLLVATSLLLATAAFAASHDYTIPVVPGYSVSKLVTSDGTDTAPTKATDGFALDQTSVVNVTVEATIPDGGYPGPTTIAGDGGIIIGCTQRGADGGCDYLDDAGVGNLTSLLAGTLRAYYRNPATGTWTRLPSMDQNITAGLTSVTLKGIDFSLKAGRIAFVPYGLGPGVKIYIHHR